MLELEPHVFDVDANSYLGIKSKFLGAVTGVLLDQSTTDEPYAAAVARNAVDEDMRELLADYKREPDLKPIVDDWLSPINDTMQEWWAEAGLDPVARLDVTDLQFVGRVNEAISPRHNQFMFTRENIPYLGPISAWMVLKGSVSFFVAMSDLSPFKITDRLTFNKEIKQSDAQQMSLKKPTFVAHEGDLVLTTNFPPTKVGTIPSQYGGEVARFFSYAQLWSQYQPRALN